MEQPKLSLRALAAACCGVQPEELRDFRELQDGSSAGFSAGERQLGSLPHRPAPEACPVPGSEDADP